jgi:hypothetical protein
MTLDGHQSDKLIDEEYFHQSTPKLTVAKADFKGTILLFVHY